MDISGVDSISIPKMEEMPNTTSISTHMRTATGLLTDSFGSVILY